MTGYNTEQKKILLDFLIHHKDNSFTIEEIYEHLTSLSDTAPGLSTLYRLMPKLVAEGKVKRFSGDKKRRFLYQIIGGEHCNTHLHMKCNKCGKILHMNEGVSKSLLEEIQNLSNFSVDRGKTILFGTCEECERNKK